MVISRIERYKKKIIWLKIGIKKNNKYNKNMTCLKIEKKL
jgi:hypothetical protein